MKIDNLQELQDFLSVCRTQEVAEVKLGDLVVVFVGAVQATPRGLTKSEFGTDYDDPSEDPDLYGDGEVPDAD